MLNHIFKQDLFTKIQFILAIGLGLVLGFMTVYATPLVVFAVMFTILSVFLILKRPELAILGILVFTSSIFPPESNLGVSLGFGTIYLTDILLFVSLLLIIVRSLVEPRFNIVRTPFDFPLILFVGIAFLSTFLAIIYTPLTLRLSLHEMRIVANYLLFFATVNLIRNDNQLRFLSRGLIIIATIVAITMIYQYILGSSISIFSGLGSSARVEVLKSDGVVYSQVTRIIPPGYSLVFVVFIVLSVILLHHQFSIRNRILTIPWVLSGIGVVLTFKRHLWVAVILAFFFILYFSGRKDLQRAIVGGIIILFFAIVGLFYVFNFTGSAGPKLVNASIDRLTSIVEPESYTSPNSSFRWREFEYEYAFPQIASHPILGLGLGAQYRPYIIPRDWEGSDLRNWIHNGHMWIMVKTGLPAYILFLWLMLLSLFRGFKYWRLIPDSWKRSHVLGYTLALSGIMTGAMIEPLIMSWQWTALIGVMMGINEVIIKNALRETQNRRLSPNSL